MGRSERAWLLAAVFSLAACGPPSRRADSALDIAGLAETCKTGAEDACTWLGNNALAGGKIDVAVEAYEKGCRAGREIDCAHLFQVATSAGVLSPEKRLGVLDRLCAAGAGEACGVLADDAAASPSPDAKKRAVLWLKTACERGDDIAACERLAQVFDTATFGGARVLAERDPAAAIDLHQRTCETAFDRKPWEPEPPRASRSTTPRELEAKSCEALGDHYLAGDGVSADRLRADDAYRHGSNRVHCAACTQKRATLVRDPQIEAYDKQQEAAEAHALGEANVLHEAELAEARAQAREERAEQRELDRLKDERAEAAAAAEAESRDRALGAFSSGWSGAAARAQPPPRQAVSRPYAPRAAPAGGIGRDSARSSAGGGEARVAARAPSVRGSHPALAPVSDDSRGSKGRRAPPPPPPNRGDPDAVRKQNLAACLAQPVMQTVMPPQTNQFLAHAMIFQRLQEMAKGTCGAAKTWAQWNDCMGSNAMGALWRVEDDGASDSDALFRRFRAVGPYFNGNACLEGFGIRGTRASCLSNAGTLEVVRNRCISMLQDDIDKMTCDNGMLPQVWDAENKKINADASAQAEGNCHALWGF